MLEGVLGRQLVEELLDIVETEELVERQCLL